MRLGKAIALGGASAFLVAGCSASSSGDQPGATELPPAKFSTPLEGRDALQDLGVFGYCGDPLDNEIGGTDVACFIEKKENIINRQRLSLRGVYLEMRRDGPLEGLCEDDFIPDDVPIVTDGRTFLVLGTIGREFGGDGFDFSGWPEELWPEDVQRVLGGAVISQQDLCE